MSFVSVYWYVGNIYVPRYTMYIKESRKTERKYKDSDRCRYIFVRKESEKIWKEITIDYLVCWTTNITTETFKRKL